MKRAIKFKLFSNIIALLMVNCMCLGQTDKYSDYTISLSINPQSGNAYVKGQLKYVKKDSSDNDFSFYIDSNMVFDKLSVNGLECLPYKSVKSDNRYMPLARKIVIKKKYFTKVEDVIEFSYSGKFGIIESMSANVVGKEWTEIGLYLPWFPYSPDDAALFNYRIEIVNQEGYQIFGIGNISVNKRKTVISSIYPTNDIPIFLSNNIKLSTFSNNGDIINIFHKPENLDYFLQLSSHILQVTDILQNIPTRQKKFEITIIESQRDSGGGYARLGGIILAGLDPNDYEKGIIATKMYLAHEFAHLWWYKAKSTEWEDWLNESFAEMSALLAIRKTEGEEMFDYILEKKINKSKLSPVIWGFDRNGSNYEVAYKILYNKGVCFLVDLEKKIGRESFAKLFSYLSELKLNSTNQLLESITQYSGKDVADWFERKLKNE